MRYFPLLHISDLHGENIIFRKRHKQLKRVSSQLIWKLFCFPKNPEQQLKQELGVQNIRQKLIQENKYKGLTDAEKAIIREMRRGFFDSYFTVCAFRDLSLSKTII